MKTVNNIGIIVALLLVVQACKNRDINEGEQFRPREIHENIEWHFDDINVDGVEYLILEKDNNNPHEGFGFMALRGNVLFSKQDSILAYLKTQQDIQIEILSHLTNKSKSELQKHVNGIFDKNITDYKTQIEERKFDSHSNLRGVKTKKK